MKTVFSNSQLAHVWFSQAQTHGKNANGSMFFKDNTIYSYGHHYPMAAVYNKNTEQEYVLINSSGYSKTTAKHTRDVYRALSLTTISFEVPDVETPNSGNNIQHMHQVLILDLIKSFEDRSHTHAPVDVALTLQRAVSEYNRFLKCVGEKPQDIVFTEAQVTQWQANMNKKLDACQVRNAKKQAERDAYDRQRAILNEQFRGEYEESLSQWLNGKTSEIKHAWRFNESIDLCRINAKAGLVETHRGAEVPLKHALLLLNKLDTTSPESLIGQRVGHFRVDAVNGDVLTIGCHNISISNVKDMFKRFSNKAA